MAGSVLDFVSQPPLSAHDGTITPQLSAAPIEQLSIKTGPVVVSISLPAPVLQQAKENAQKTYQTLSRYIAVTLMNAHNADLAKRASSIGAGKPEPKPTLPSEESGVG